MTIEYVFGVDIGTDKSSVFVRTFDGCQNDRVHLTDDFGTQATEIPSYARIDPELWKIQIGLSAKQEFENDQSSEYVLANWKMHLFDSEGLPPLYKNSGNNLTPARIIDHLCELLSESILRQFGDIQAKSAVVITFPAIENGHIGQLSSLYEEFWSKRGWKTVKALQEPVAVAQKIVTDIEENHLPIDRETTLIIDSGAGTTDIAILDLEKANPEEMLITAHAIEWGGRNIDSMISKIFDIPAQYARGMKEGLRKSDPFDRPIRDRRLRIDSQSLIANTEFMSEINTRLICPINDFLKENGLDKKIKQIYLSGGTSWFNILRIRVEEFSIQNWSSPRLYCSQTPFTEVCQGAADYYMAEKKKRLRPTWSGDLYIKLQNPNTKQNSYLPLVSHGEKLPTQEFAFTLWPSANDNSLEITLCRKDGNDFIESLSKTFLFNWSYSTAHQFTFKIKISEDYQVQCWGINTSNVELFRFEAKI